VWVCSVRAFVRANNIDVHTLNTISTLKVPSTCQYYKLSISMVAKSNVNSSTPR
jgi:hypothetical protein